MNKILEALSNNGFATADYLVILLYIVILVGMGLFLSRSKKGEEKSSTDYFLAGNTLTWWAVGASLIAANISAEQFIGMSGSAYASGIAQAAYELMAAATLLVVGKFLLPLMIEKKIFTIPQFLRERYNWGVGFAFSLLWLFLYVFVNLTSVAWLGALAIQQILGLPTDMVFMFAGMEIDMVRMIIILSLFVIAGVYSIYGGLASVAWTDVMQVVFLVGGGLITAYAALDVIGAEMNLGGAWDALVHIKDYLAGIEGDKHFNLVVTRNEELYPVIKEQAIAYGIAFADHNEIDEINILQATYLAMERAINQLSVKPDLALIDGNRAKDFGIPVETVVHGDSLSASIAAASVLAKVTRDDYMLKMAEEYPGYDFEIHKGYGTKAHYAALTDHGPSPIHRKTFLKKFYGEK